MSSKVKSSVEAGSSAALLPKFRFPQFQDAGAWETAPGNELFQQVSNREAPPGLPILAITQEHGAIPRHMIDYHVSVTDKSLETYKEVRPGDFIISLRSFQGGIEFSDYHGICSPAYVILRKRGRLSDTFYRQYFKSYDFIQKLTRNLEGLRDGKMISYKQFSQLQLLKPSVPEQKKIADCLDSADALIAVQERKVEALKAHKKSLMKQLFPQEGETQPRIRFPEFMGGSRWRPARLGNHVEIGSGGSPSKLMLSSKGKYALVKVEDLNNCIKYQFTGRDFCNDKRGVVPLNSIVFPKRGAAIWLNKIRITAAEFLIDTNLMALTPKNGLGNEFLYYYIICVGLSQIADNSTIPQINNKHIIPFEFSLPVLQEQQRIADCLASLDQLIAAEIRKRDMLETHKKGLVQQLFPVIQESQS